MKITTEELLAAGFRRAGTVYPDVTKKLRVQIDWDVRGFVVYIMVVNQEFEKAGTTGRKNSTFKGRMHSTFSALRRRMITGGSPTDDPFKTHAPAVIEANQEIELWAQQFTIDTFEAKETELNNKYQPEWTKEGKHRASK